MLGRACEDTLDLTFKRIKCQRDRESGEIEVTFAKGHREACPVMCGKRVKGRRTCEKVVCGGLRKGRARQCVKPWPARPWAEGIPRWSPDPFGGKVTDEKPKQRGCFPDFHPEDLHTIHETGSAVLLL